MAPSNHTLPADTLMKVFIQQLSILYCANQKLTAALPDLIEAATFPNLKLALTEELNETKSQMLAIQSVFHELKQSAITDNCLCMNILIDEARKQVIYHEDDHYGSDMTIIFYMNVIENMQVGAGRVLNLLASKTQFQNYTQRVTESFDMHKDNARLFNYVAEEYLS